MFLSKASPHILYDDDQTDKRRKRSTHSTLKSDALKFLQTFRQEQAPAALNTSLSSFIAELLSYMAGIFAPGTVEIYKATLNKFFA